MTYVPGEAEALRQRCGDLFLKMADHAEMSQRYRVRMWIWFGVAMLEGFILWVAL